MRGWGAAAAVTIAAWGASSPAAAEPCDSKTAEAGVPVRVPLGPADFGSLPEACSATAAELRGRFTALIATDDFYGTLQLGAAARVRFELPWGLWFSSYLPGIDYRFVANATVESDAVDVSGSTLAAHVPLRVNDWLQLAPYGRVMLPTETVFHNAHRWGIEHGMAATARLGDDFELVGGYALPLLLTGNERATHTLAMPTVTIDAGYRPWSWSQLMLGAALRIVPRDPEPFESFDPRAALRFYPWGSGIIDLSAAFPLFGRDRTLTSVGLTVGALL